LYSCNASLSPIHKGNTVRNSMPDKNYFSPLNPQLPNKPGERRYWGRLYGSSKAMALNSAVEKSEVPIVIITADLNCSNQLLQELSFYRNDSADNYQFLSFPDWETLPYDQFSPYQDITSERLAILAKLPKFDRGVLIVPVMTIMHRLMPKTYINSFSLMLKTGQTLNTEGLCHELRDCGYRIVSQVTGHGDVAIRGSLIDIYPMGSDIPYRIDLFDREIDSIRIFDPETQRSEGAVSEIHVLPAREVAMLEENIKRFRSNWRKRFEGNPGTSPVYKDVSNFIAPAGVEYYLPLFYEHTNSLFDYLDKHCLVGLDEGAQEAAELFWQDIEDRYEQRKYDVDRPLLSPRELFYHPSELFTQIKAFPQLRLSSLVEDESRAGVINYASKIPVKLPVDAHSSDPLLHLKRFIETYKGRVLLVAESSGRRETINELLIKHGLRPKVFSQWSDFQNSTEILGLTVAPLENGAILLKPMIAIISESQLFSDRVQQRRLRKRKQQDTDTIVRNLTELTIGAPVVHEEHGVGRYLGLVTLDAGGYLAEYIFLEYDQEDKLYIPVSSLNLISRYTGADPEHAPLHRLGSGQWQKAKKKAAERVHDVAAELLELHARRASRAGHQFKVDEDAYNSYIQSFPFEETPGQMNAIQDVIKDMREAKPMDRLVCGDSGFGKTEVALRAAFIAVQNNMQVALLAPTTLLAQQHYQNFKDRFADWPVSIEMLSRFRTKKEQAEVISTLDQGKVDIIIGTHKLLQRDVKYKQLGLVIIDEEHRFGVRQKEQFKSLRAEIDVLTLTATPIPRTLNMALSELRDLSIIATPPLKRQPIQTFIREWNGNTVKEALLREVKRGGQVYFLHNKVENIEKIAHEVEALIPEARVQFAHGQMPEKQLEQVMTDFYHQRFNILVCTTIVETGIDVPNANTIIINRADKFGLAQLYQLRGRVGRSHHRAYAYLIVPARKAMTRGAVRRLEAIESLEELGIGLTLATHDLEIRGTGEILGDEQSGQIQEIGFGMYMEMLDRAVRAMKSGKHMELDRPLDHGAEVNLHIPALIPEDYLPDVHNRLIMYKRIASAEDGEELQGIQEEMIDRFGLLPPQLKNLFEITILKQKANLLGIRKIDIGQQGGRMFFHAQTSIVPGNVINLIQSEPSVYKLDGQDKLRIIKELPDARTRFNMFDSLLDRIACRDAA